MGSSGLRIGGRPGLGNLGLWVALTASGLAALGHQTARVYEIYVRPQGASGWGFASALASVTTAVVVFRWHALRGSSGDEHRPATLLAGASVAALLLGVLPFAAFDHGRAAVVVACSCVAAAVFVGTWAALEICSGAGRTALALGFVEHGLRPLPLLAFVGLGAGFLVLEAHVGCLRSSLLVSAWLALSAGTSAPVHALIGRAATGSSPVAFNLALATVLAAFGVGVAADRRLPLSELARYPDEIVFASDGAVHRYIVTAAPGGYELFRDGQLRVATLDARRYAAALTLPVLGAAPGPTTGKRVLVLDGGEGVIARAVSSASGVTCVAELTVVSDDEEAARLGQAVPFLANLVTGGGSAARAPRVTHVTAELIPWLSSEKGVWDVVIANLPAPLGYGEGKYYTHHFFGLLSERLGPRGLAVLPATSAFSAPESFSDIRATLESAGLHVKAYHASMPTLGVASFLVGSRTLLGSLTESLDSSAALGGAADVGRDLTFERAGKVATLFDEHVVDTFAASREPRGE